jgi:CDP-paratose 2-epimerase
MNSPVLICGGAGFVGTNVAAHLMADGQRVLILDDLSSAGVERNLEWLRRTYGPLLEFELGDIRDSRTVRRCVRDVAAVFHFAARSAAASIGVNAREALDISAGGTINLLEELRLRGSRAPLVFTSTNKVYGNLDKLAVRRNGKRYEPQHPGVLAHGIAEDWPVSFQTPYGCSKGAAEQYVLEYARAFGLPNVVFRLSCIYGPHQCGNEDQGWVADFIIRTLLRQPITIWGDGCQVRDALFVDDLANAVLLAVRNAHTLAGRAFNIGGGPGVTTSVMELLDMIGNLKAGRRRSALKTGVPAIRAAMFPIPARLQMPPDGAPTSAFGRAWSDCTTGFGKRTPCR